MSAKTCRLRRDGFVMRRDFLDAATFAALKEAVFDFLAPAREWAGRHDHAAHRTRCAALKGRAAVARTSSRGPDWRGLMRYVGPTIRNHCTTSRTIPAHVEDAAPDPQTIFSLRTPPPSVKACSSHDVAETRVPSSMVPLAPDDAGAARLGGRNEPQVRDRP